MAKGLARTFGQDLMRGEHEVGGDKTNGGVLMPSHTSGDPSFYAKKRAKEAELGRGEGDRACPGGSPMPGNGSRKDYKPGAAKAVAHG